MSRDFATVQPPDPERVRGVDIRISEASVQVGGQTILSGIDLHIAAGSHLAIVGPSGAGKTTLMGLLLGFHHPVAGRVRIDGAPLSAERLKALRRDTAWVDPTVQLWDRSLLYNLQYGTDPETTVPMATVLQQADLLDVLQRLPEGMRTRLGESGRLVAGGEGQRVRLGRALYRPDVRLVILDEPFRGLDRPQRRRLLARARGLWSQATLLFVSHDVGATLDFERVVFLDEGRIACDGPPADLARQPKSRYRDLLQAEEGVRERLWASAEIPWRKLWLENGRLRTERREERPGD